MVIDTSALVAILLMEPDRLYFEGRIAEAQSCQISAVSYTESGMVLTTRFGNYAEAALDQMLARARVSIVAVNAAQAKLALAAFRDYGKGRHLAGLNFGDCFSYALAKSVGEPLLFKGSDFSKTDIASA